MICIFNKRRYIYIQQSTSIVFTFLFNTVNKQRYSCKVSQGRIEIIVYSWSAPNVRCSVSHAAHLHTVVPADDSPAVRAAVGHILAAIHTEWDEATAKITSDNAQDKAYDPGEGASLILGSSDHLSLAMGAASVDRRLTELLHHSHSRLSHNYSGLSLLLGIPWLTLWRCSIWLSVSLWWWWLSRIT